MPDAGAGALRSVAPMSETEMLREWNTFCEPRERKERERRRLEEEREREREILEGRPPAAVGSETQEQVASTNVDMATVATETTSTQAESVKADTGVPEGESERADVEPSDAASSASQTVPKPGSPVLKQEKALKPEAEASVPEEVSEGGPRSAALFGLELSEDEQSEANGAPGGGLETPRRKRRERDDSPIVAMRSSLKRKRLHISDDEQVGDYRTTNEESYSAASSNGRKFFFIYF